MMPQKRSRSRAIGGALLVLAFITGAAAGVTADRLLAPGPLIRTRISADMSGVLDKLGLTSAQRAQADAIIQKSAPRSREAMLEVADRLRSVADSLDAELRAILTPEQRTRLDALKHQPMFMLKRKQPGGATTIDTVFPLRTSD
jgi:Spy/CpxP family protein refolding chaperone